MEIERARFEAIRLRTLWRAAKQSTQLKSQNIEKNLPGKPCDLVHRLELSDALARKLFARTQELEVSLAKAETGVPSRAPKSIDGNKAIDEQNSLSDFYRRTIAELQAKLRLLESSATISKLRSANLECERTMREYRQLEEDYRRLASRHTDAGIIESLRDRILACERGRIADSVHLNARIFAAEQEVCEVHAAKNTIEMKLEELSLGISHSERSTVLRKETG